MKFDTIPSSVGQFVVTWKPIAFGNDYPLVSKLEALGYLGRLDEQHLVAGKLTHDLIFQEIDKSLNALRPADLIPLKNDLQQKVAALSELYGGGEAWINDDLLDVETLDIFTEFDGAEMVASMYEWHFHSEAEFGVNLQPVRSVVRDFPGIFLTVADTLAMWHAAHDQNHSYQPSWALDTQHKFDHVLREHEEMNQWWEDMSFVSPGPALAEPVSLATAIRSAINTASVALTASGNDFQLGGQAEEKYRSPDGLFEAHVVLALDKDGRPGANLDITVSTVEDAAVSVLVGKEVMFGNATGMLAAALEDSVQCSLELREVGLLAGDTGQLTINGVVWERG